jgi:hypothetical protein
MKNIALLILIAAASAGCCSVNKNQTCVAIRFKQEPTKETQRLLAATAGESVAEVNQWFTSGQRGFVINDDRPELDRNALLAALAEGAKVTNKHDARMAWKQ